MNALFLAIEAQLKAAIPGMFVNPWNDQFADVEAGKVYSFPFPCAFIEFVNEQEVKQLGNGVQLFDPLIVRIHFGHEWYDDQDGNQERNLEVVTKKDLIHKKLQKFEPDGAVAFVRISETRDYSHTNIYHFILEYRTNYIDNSTQEPRDSTVTTPPTALEVNVDPEPPYLKTI